MLFNSLEFAIFLPLVFLCYWFVFNKTLKLQNLFIVVVSYVFYGWWNWHFLLLMGFTTLCSYLSGIFIEDAKSHRIARWISVANIILNLGILGVYKYYNFFVGSLVDAFASLGMHIDVGGTLHLVLPVGISFYTFQALSYSIDVYKKKLNATRDVVTFFAYVSFFPQLVAGPIERATHLIPQFQKPRVFEYDKAADGMRQILWGLFKKIVIADACAPIVANIFNHHTTFPALVLILGAVLFTFQIYCDFSGYSDIAIGVARLFGVDLMRNFNYPYFSRDIAEFWRRWHISLSTWFRDYLYIPLGGSRGTKWMSLRNTLIIFTVSGLWHGANWTYVVWGAYHGLLFVPLLLLKRNRKNTNTVAEGRILPSIKEFFQMMFTFGFAVLGWIIFRSKTIGDAWEYICGIFNHSLFENWTNVFNVKFLRSFNAGSGVTAFIILNVCLVFFLLAEWIGRNDQFAIASITKIKVGFLRSTVYLIIILFIVFFGQYSGSNQFIYFQF